MQDSHEKKEDAQMEDRESQGQLEKIGWFVSISLRITWGEIMNSNPSPAYNQVLVTQDIEGLFSQYCHFV